jgi:hypothetical protein
MFHILLHFAQVSVLGTGRLENTQPFPNDKELNYFYHSIL